MKRIVKISEHSPPLNFTFCNLIKLFFLYFRNRSPVKYPVAHYDSRMIEVKGRLFAAGGNSQDIKKVYELNKDNLSWTLFKDISQLSIFGKLTMVPYNLG